MCDLHFAYKTDSLQPSVLTTQGCVLVIFLNLNLFDQRQGALVENTIDSSITRKPFRLSESLSTNPSASSFLAIHADKLTKEHTRKKL